MTETRINRGRQLIAANADLFTRLQDNYGVPAEVLTAIWAVETGYGQNEGTYNLFEALATLAYQGPRMDYGRKQFIAALKIAEVEHRDPVTMKGSWAGAFGHTQFVPTTFLENAVDGDGDGKRDVWDSPADALASAANYLKRSGWRAGDAWGEEVQLPSGFAFDTADPETKKPIAEWAGLAFGGQHRFRGDLLAGRPSRAGIPCTEQFRRHPQIQRRDLLCAGDRSDVRSFERGVGRAGELARGRSAAG
jgi:lytic murein transglycosylase